MGPEAQVALDAADAALRGEALEGRLRDLEQQLIEARQQRDTATKTEQQQQALVKQSSADLDAQNKLIATSEADLRERENKSLAARTLIQALHERHGSFEALAAALGQSEQRCKELQSKLEELEDELAKLGTESLKARAAEIDKEIGTLDGQERSTQASQRERHWDAQK